MTKVQTGLVIEFYSNSCLVRTKEHDIPCIGIKDVVVGDQVNIEIIQDSKKIRGVILSKEPRKSSLRKKQNSKSKVIAANLSHVGILFTPQPKTTSEFIDKWILTTILSDIKPFIICNKIDLEHDELYERNLSVYEKLDIQIIKISAKKELNTNNLINFLKKKCVLFVGNSGAGKSTITSLLTGKKIKTNSLSNNQGMHTTSISTLYQTKNDISIIDSPGVRDLPISGWNKDEILFGFQEIYKQSKKCKFNDCNHINNKECAVLDHLSNGEIDESRYNNFIKFRDSDNCE
jgi:ribosome biogenesis GTPase